MTIFFFERTRSQFPTMAKAAEHYLSLSMYYVEHSPLALPVGMDVHEKNVQEMTEWFNETIKELTENQAIHFLAHSLERVEYAPKALPVGNEYVHCGDLHCKLRNVCIVKEISKETHDACVCAKTGKTFGFCQECGEYAEELTSVYNERGQEIFVCEDCLKESFVQCQDCGEYFSKDHDFIEVENFGPICQNCYDEGGFFYCEECEKTFTEDCAVYIEGKEIYVCEDCAEENYYKCDFCGRYTDYDHAIFSQDYPQTCICHDCYDSGSYEICASCGAIVCTESNDFGTYTDNGYFCADCAPENTAVRAYGYKPKPVFHKSAKDTEKGNLYFGIELEFSHDSYGYREENLNKAIDCLNSGEFEKDYYFKEDSSLECGFETVSHPRTLSSWLEEREKFEKWLSFAADNVLEGRDGLHIHISRKGMTVPHMTRFSAFMSMYSEQARIIARRNSTYSTYREKPHNGREVKALLRNRSRYEAVNWENSSTVELRIFRNTTSVTTFFACIEFAHALYQFTKNHCSLLEILKGKAWIEFLKFLNTDTRYQDLRGFLSLSFKNDTEHEEEYRILNKKKLDLSLVKYCLA